MPRISTGYWNARKSPARARSSGFMSSKSLPSYAAVPASTVYAGWPARTCASVLLPEPFGPMIACTSPAATRKSTPRKMGLPSTLTWRFLISSMAISADTSFQTYAEQFLRLDREFHRQLLEDLLAESVDDHRDGVFGRESALHAVEQLILADARSRGFVLDLRRGVLHLDVGKRVRRALVAEQQRIALRVIARAHCALR